MHRLLHRGLPLVLLALVTSACNGAPRDNAAADSKAAEAAASITVTPLDRPATYWKDLVSPDAWNVLFREATEPPGSSPLNDEHRNGTFVCAACYLPLFESKTKFNSGTGWPSFYAPIESHVAFKEDFKIGYPRTEYHCARCGGHQGHVFDDGPKPTGQRWCNNGVALRFIPAGEALPPLRGGDGAAPAMSPESDSSATAIFAGGCFWCMETAFEGVEGVSSVISGYTGGHTVNPTYEEVNTHTTGHVEAVKVTYDPAKISYDQLLDIFWHNVDPTDGGGQFCDRGNTYVSEIFTLNDTQKTLAEASKARAKSWLKMDKPIVTTIRDAAPFYDAEDYHQDYYKKNPEHYRSYRLGCGRDARLKELWGEAPAHH